MGWSWRSILDRRQLPQGRLSANTLFRIFFLARTLNLNLIPAHRAFLWRFGAWWQPLSSSGLHSMRFILSEVGFASSEKLSV